MTIRRKLLLLLLTMALVPLVVVSGFHQISIRLARQRLSNRIERALDANARVALQEILDNHDEIFQREIRLTDALLRRQVREAELRLAQTPGPLASVNLGSDYGFDDNLAELSEPNLVLLVQDQAQVGRQPRISYRRQEYFVPQGVDIKTVAADLARLETMTGVYHEIRRSGASGMLWQYTSLESGLHVSYPWIDALHYPPSYDPRQRDWYLRAKSKGDVIRVGPIVDAVTGQTIITAAAPVRRPDGSLAGVTAMDKCLPEVLANMKLPFRWAEGAERMLVAPDPEADPCEPKVTVVVQASYASTHGDWWQPIELEQLQSEDRDELRSLAADVRSGSPGIRQMRYRGRVCLWAYGKPIVGSVVPLLIVPYDKVVEMARSTARSLLNESRLWLGVTGIVLLLVGGTTVAVATTRARLLTQPIMDLTQAGRHLAAGDYEARVLIATGDELEQLGAVFNATGPKLKERQLLKKSLELAGAIQRSLLPAEAPGFKHFDLAAECLYCDETGGDYYDFIEITDLGPGKTGIALGDVSGHGIGAALLMAVARSSLRINARHFGMDLAGLFREVNRDLVRDTGEDKFVTLFYGVLDDEASSLTWASGGHDPALWLAAHTGEIQELPNTGMLMGIFKDAVFEQAGPLKLKSGDVVLVGTDGIWEARGPDGTMFGKERLFAILRETQGSAQDICTAIVTAVTQFCGSAAREDDITVVVLKAL